MRTPQSFKLVPLRCLIILETITYIGILCLSDFGVFKFYLCLTPHENHSHFSFHHHSQVKVWSYKVVYIILSLPASSSTSISTFPCLPGISLGGSKLSSLNYDKHPNYCNILAIAIIYITFLDHILYMHYFQELQKIFWKCLGIIITFPTFILSIPHYLIVIMFKIYCVIQSLIHGSKTVNIA